MAFVKLIIKKIIRFFLHIFWVFPIDKKKVCFVSHNGKGFNCNPYYIYQYLKENTDYKLVWALNNKAQVQNENIIVVKPKSLLCIYHFLTTGTLVVNTGFSSFLPFRKSQLIIDTWHGGGAYKHTGNDFAKEMDVNTKDASANKKKHLGFMISSNEKFCEAMQSSQGIDYSQFLNIGMPRNDIFFNKKLVETTNIKVRKLLNINENVFVVLYAPTFRGIGNYLDANTNLDYQLLKQSVEKRFNRQAIILFRGHYFINNNQPSEVFINVSSYPNMQELLCAADMLITDYSSSIWDFSLTYKPGFLFTPDLDQYDSERGFYTPISEWQYPYAKTNEELFELIIKYDESKSKEKIQAHFELLGSFEDGHATEKVCELIVKKNKH